MVVGRVRNNHKEQNILFPEESNVPMDFEMLQNGSEWHLQIKLHFLDYRTYVYFKIFIHSPEQLCVSSNWITGCDAFQ